MSSIRIKNADSTSCEIKYRNAAIGNAANHGYDFGLPITRLTPKQNIAIAMNAII
jgi:hypothetical protein